MRASENRLNDRFDAVMAAIDNVATDQVAEQSQLNRHEDWIVKADKIAYAWLRSINLL